MEEVASLAILTVLALCGVYRLLCRIAEEYEERARRSEELWNAEGK